MGCKNGHESAHHGFSLTERMCFIIDTENKGKLEEFCSEDIDERFIKYEDIEHNPLSYALWRGKAKSFKILHQNLNANISAMENILIDQGICPIIVACNHGNLELFSYYLPLYVKNQSRMMRLSVTTEQILIDDITSRAETIESVVLQACRRNHLHILSYISGFNSELVKIPYYLDINYIDSKTGENCALIACRNCNYVMVKYLFRANADFTIKNKHGKSALQILAQSNVEKHCPCFYNCFEFLVDIVQIDYLYDYEETLNLLLDEQVIQFFEKKLEKEGIFFTKYDIQTIYSDGVYIDNKINDSRGSNFRVAENYQREGFIRYLTKNSMQGGSFLSNASE